MSIIYCTGAGLDGFIADPDESLSWLFGTPNHRDVEVPDDIHVFAGDVTELPPASRGGRRP